MIIYTFIVATFCNLELNLQILIAWCLSKRSTIVLLLLPKSRIPLLKRLAKNKLILPFAQSTVWSFSSSSFSVLVFAMRFILTSMERSVLWTKRWRVAWSIFKSITVTLSNSMDNASRFTNVFKRKSQMEHYRGLGRS